MVVLFLLDLVLLLEALLDNFPAHHLLLWHLECKHLICSLYASACKSIWIILEFIKMRLVHFNDTLIGSCVHSSVHDINKA